MAQPKQQRPFCLPGHNKRVASSLRKIVDSSPWSQQFPWGQQEDWRNAAMPKTFLGMKASLDSSLLSNIRQLPGERLVLMVALQLHVQRPLTASASRSKPTGSRFPPRPLLKPPSQAAGPYSHRQGSDFWPHQHPQADLTPLHYTGRTGQQNHSASVVSRLCYTHTAGVKRLYHVPHTSPSVSASSVYASKG